MVNKKVRQENCAPRAMASALALTILLCLAIPAAPAQLAPLTQAAPATQPAQAVAQTPLPQIAPDTALVATMSGRVSVERSGELWALSEGQIIDAGQTIVTGIDGSAKLALPDGSQLEIFPNSRVVLRANRFNLRDLLDLYLGKVRFEIQHILPGETPLRVTSPTAVISVRGTVFEVEVDPTQDTVVSVDTGAVSVRHRLIAGQEVMVEAGQSVRVSPSLPLMAVTKPVIPAKALGRVAQAVADTLAQINAVRASSGGHGTTAAHPASSGGGPSVSGSDSGSNQPAPPPGGAPGGDNTGGSSTGGSGSGSSSGSSGTGSGGGSPSAPPGDKLP